MKFAARKLLKDRSSVKSMIVPIILIYGILPAAFSVFFPVVIGGDVAILWGAVGIWAFVAFFFTVHISNFRTYYEITDDSLKLQKNFGHKTIKLSEIKSVRIIDSEELESAIKDMRQRQATTNPMKIPDAFRATKNITDILGYATIPVRTDELVRYEGGVRLYTKVMSAHVSRGAYVLLAANDSRNYAISPENPDLFIKYLNNAMKR